MNKKLSLMLQEAIILQELRRAAKEVQKGLAKNIVDPKFLTYPKADFSSGFHKYMTKGNPATGSHGTEIENLRAKENRPESAINQVRGLKKIKGFKEPAEVTKARSVLNNSPLGRNERHGNLINSVSKRLEDVSKRVNAHADEVKKGEQEIKGLIDRGKEAQKALDDALPKKTPKGKIGLGTKIAAGMVATGLGLSAAGAYAKKRMRAKAQEKREELKRSRNALKEVVEAIEDLGQK